VALELKTRWCSTCSELTVPLYSSDAIAQQYSGALLGSLGYGAEELVYREITRRSTSATVRCSIASLQVCSQPGEA
jgi:hypothetical protein